MTQQKLTAFINDSCELAISLEWAGVAFEPGEDWLLIFTAKDSADDLDSAAVFQKASGAGIDVAGSIATVSLVPSDTELLLEGARLFDIQAQNIITEKVRTIAFGELYIMRDITRLTETSVDVVTTETPLPFARTAVETHAATSKAVPVNADEIPITDSADSFTIKKLTWANLKATLKAYFDTLYHVTAVTWGEITGKPVTFPPDLAAIGANALSISQVSGLDPRLFATLGLFEQFDDSNRYAENSIITNNVSQPRIGADKWWLNLSGTPAPKVQSGAYAASANGLWYLGSSVPTASSKMTLGFIFELRLNPTTTTGYSNIFNISFSETAMQNPATGAIDPTGVVHINFDRGGMATIEFYGGAAIPCISTIHNGVYYPWNNLTSPILQLGRKYAIILKVDGNYLTITIPGVGTQVFYHASLSGKIGAAKTYFWFEDGRSDAYASIGALYRVWGGAGATVLDADSAYGAFVGGSIPSLNSNGAHIFPGTICSAPNNTSNGGGGTPLQMLDTIPGVGYGLKLGATSKDGSNFAIGGNALAEGGYLANQERTAVGGSEMARATMALDNSITAQTTTATTGARVVLAGISRLQNKQAGDRQYIEISGNALAGNKTLDVIVFATGEVVGTFGPTALTGAWCWKISRQSHTANTDVCRAELYIGPALVYVNRIVFNNGNYFPYQFGVTQDTANCVVLDGVLNIAQKVKHR